MVFDIDQDCHFGDDIDLSDNLAEKLLCLEGGTISFCQLVNTLSCHAKPGITLLYGIRDSQACFSAAELLAKLKEANSIDELSNIKESYLDNKAIMEAVKQKQVNEAFAKLIKIEGILEKLKNIKVKATACNLTKAGLFQEPSEYDSDSATSSLVDLTSVQNRQN